MQLFYWGSHASFGDRNGPGVEFLIILDPGTSLLFLALLGASAARAGGAGVTAGALRVDIPGPSAMGVTGGVGAGFGTIV